MGTVLSLLGLWPRYIGGSEIYLRELARQLAEHSWDSVACFVQEPTAEVREFLTAANIEIEVLENASSPNAGTIKKFASIMRRHRPQIVHLHLVGFLGPYPWLARLLSARRVFFTDHGSRPEDYVAARAPFWKRFAVRLINWPITNVISVSEYNRVCMTKLDLLPARRFARIYNAVDFSRIGYDGRRGREFRQRHGIPGERIVVLQVSWIIRAKGIEDVLSAARLVLQQNPAVHFVFVGEGDERETFMQQAANMGISQNITWTGLVNDPFAEGVYEASDIVCQASRWQEAFGQVVAEAMASGKPVVATRVGGIPEVVEDSKSAFLIEKGDVTALAERILQLAADPQLRSDMGQLGKQFAYENFELQNMVRQTMDLYEVASAGDIADRQLAANQHGYTRA
jgi:glycosyltransferase involved in cell wall biosynthesis